MHQKYMNKRHIGLVDRDGESTHRTAGDSPAVTLRHLQTGPAVKGERGALSPQLQVTVANLVNLIIKEVRKRAEPCAAARPVQVKSK